MSEKKKTDIYVIVDTETGGFSPEKNAFLSLAFVALGVDESDDSQPLKVESFYGLCRPEIVDETTCTKGALDVNGFSIEEIKTREVIDTDLAKGFWGTYAKYEKIAEERGSKVYFVGQSAPFDIGFLQTKAGIKKSLNIIDTKDMIQGIRTDYNRPNSSNSFKHIITDFPEFVESANKYNKNIFGVNSKHHDARFDVCLCLTLLML